MNAGTPDSSTENVFGHLEQIRLVHASHYMPSVAVIVVLVVGSIYLVLVIHTIRSLSLHGGA
jgi:hypothetical protein